MFRYFVAWLTSKLPWMDDEKRAARKTHLAQMQQKLDRDMEEWAERRAQESADLKSKVTELNARLNRPRDKRP